MSPRVAQRSSGAPAGEVWRTALEGWRGQPCWRGGCAWQGSGFGMRGASAACWNAKQERPDLWLGCGGGKKGSEEGSLSNIARSSDRCLRLRPLIIPCRCPSTPLAGSGLPCSNSCNPSSMMPTPPCRPSPKIHPSVSKCCGKDGDCGSSEGLNGKAAVWRGARAAGAEWRLRGEGLASGSKGGKQVEGACGPTEVASGGGAQLDFPQTAAVGGSKSSQVLWPVWAGGWAGCG